MKRVTIPILVFIMLFVSLTSFSYAKDTVSMSLNSSNESISKGEKVYFTLSEVSDFPANISTFRITITFDSSRLEFKGLSAIDGFLNEEFKYNLQGDTLTIIYLTNSNGVNVNKGENIDIFELQFAALKDCNYGTVVLSSQVDGLANYDTDEIFVGNMQDLMVQIVPEEIGDCTLNSLALSVGELVPVFDPLKTEYTVDVPYGTSEIEVYADPTDKQATVKVNRRTLNKAGSQTALKVTVTSADSKAKMIYNITVNRLLKGVDVSNVKSISEKGSVSSSSKTGTSNTGSTSKDNENKISSDESYKFKTNAYDAAKSKTFLVKNNTFNTFLVAIIICVCIVAVAYIIFKYRNKKQTENENKIK